MSDLPEEIQIRCLYLDRSEEFLSVELYCPRCGTTLSRLDRKIFPEISLVNLIERALKAHEKKCHPKKDRL